MKKKDKKIVRLESIVTRVQALIAPMKIDTARLTGKETARLELARRILHSYLKLDINGKPRK